MNTYFLGNPDGPRAIALILAVLSTISGFSKARGEQFQTLCIVRELDESQVPSRVAGVIRTIDVRRGHLVNQGQQIAQLDTRETQLRYEVSEAELAHSAVRAANVGPVSAAESRLAKAREELRLIKQLGNRAVYLERYRAEQSVTESSGDLQGASNELKQAEAQAEVDQKELELISYELDQSTVRSPFVGQVREVNVNLGEYVAKGDPIAVVTRMDRLLVEGFLKSSELSPFRVTGAKAKVRIEISGSSPIELDGLVITHTSPNLEIDGKYSVWLEIENQQRPDQSGTPQWLLRPAMNGTLIVEVAD